MAALNGFEKPADIVSNFHKNVTDVHVQLNAVTTTAGTIPETVVLGQNILADNDPIFGAAALELAQQYTATVQSHLTASDSAVSQLKGKVKALQDAAQYATTKYSNGAADELATTRGIDQMLSGQPSTPGF